MCFAFLNQVPIPCDPERLNLFEKSLDCYFVTDLAKFCFGSLCRHRDVVKSI